MGRWGESWARAGPQSTQRLGGQGWAFSIRDRRCSSRFRIGWHIPHREHLITSGSDDTHRDPAGLRAAERGRGQRLHASPVLRPDASAEGRLEALELAVLRLAGEVDAAGVERLAIVVRVEQPAINFSRFAGADVAGRRVLGVPTVTPALTALGRLPAFRPVRTAGAHGTVARVRAPFEPPASRAG